MVNKMVDMTDDKLWQWATHKNGGQPPRIIDARSGKQLRIGEPFTFDDREMGTQTLARFEGAIIRVDSIGLYGIFIDEHENEKSIPMPLSYNHPAFPNEWILFVPT